MFTEIVFIGLGLIGGSLAKQIKQISPKTIIKAKARSQETIAYALKEKIIDQTEETIENLVKSADLIIIATPINLIAKYVSEIYNLAKKEAIIIDVASTKGTICRELKKYADKFIGGHPMFGREVFGLKHAEAKLAEKAKFLITPYPETPPEKLKKLKKFIKEIKMIDIEIDPQEHDQNLAAVSHLPYFVAAALLNNIKSEKQKKIAATGFQSTTRVAASDPLWGKEVAENNKAEIIEQLESLQGELEVVKELIAADDFSALQDYLEKARQTRMEIYPD